MSLGERLAATHMIRLGQYKNCVCDKESHHYPLQDCSAEPYNLLATLTGFVFVQPTNIAMLMAYQDYLEG